MDIYASEKEEIFENLSETALHFFTNSQLLITRKVRHNGGASGLSANRKHENSSSGSMYKTNQSDFVTTVGLGIKKNLKGCFWMDLEDNYSNNSWLKLL